ncbi:MAG: ion channel [Sphingomicrobium sp.]
MIEQLFAATALVLATVAIHGIGLMYLSRAMKLDEREEQHPGIHDLRTLGFTLMLVLALFLIHGIEIWLYAGVYLLAGAMPDFARALYFSTITYGTVGYDDEGLHKTWQMVAAIEGINGIILLGWSTAFFVRVIGRLGRQQTD